MNKFLDNLFGKVAETAEKLDPRCKHEVYYETMACDAICTNCGKNLGFIGTAREDKTKKEQFRGQPWK